MDFRKVVREWKAGPDRADTGILVKMLEQELERHRAVPHFDLCEGVIQFPRHRRLTSIQAPRPS